MAIDFPNSPVAGQTFAAPNGVLYAWNATYTAWLPVSVSAPGQGDFSAYIPGAITMPTSAQVMAGHTVVSGNAGGYFNPATGVFRPPAGRYNLYASWYGYSPSSVANNTINIRKNGANIGPGGYGSFPFANYWLEMSCSVTVDANGSDTFDTVASSNVAGTQGYNIAFNAIPVPTGAAQIVPVLSLPTADFCATIASFTPPGAAVLATATGFTVMSGNAGNYFNPSTGVYRPPAGRYEITCTFSMSCTVGASHAYLILRKNGAELLREIDTTGTTNYYAQPIINVTVDANGNDTFDCQQAGSAGSGNSGAWFIFKSVPVTTQVLASTPSGLFWRSLGIQTVTSPVAQVDFYPLPTDVNHVMFIFANAVPVVNDSQPILRFFDGTGTVDAGTNYYTVANYAGSNQANGAAAIMTLLTGGTGFVFTYNAATNYVNNTLAYGGITIDGKAMNLRAATRRMVTYQSHLINGANNAWANLSGSGNWTNATSMVTGLRFLFGSSNIASGVFEVWGSP